MSIIFFHFHSVCQCIHLISSIWLVNLYGPCVTNRFFHFTLNQQSTHSNWRRYTKKRFVLYAVQQVNIKPNIFLIAWILNIQLYWHSQHHFEKKNDLTFNKLNSYSIFLGSSCLWAEKQPFFTDWNWFFIIWNKT